MLNILFKTKISKINETFEVDEIKAGILFDEDGNAIDKIMFQEVDGVAKKLFNDECYLLESLDTYYVDNVVSLANPLKNFFRSSNLNLAQLFMAYKMFLNDSAFINRHLDYFGMFIRPVGYKEKWESAKDPSSFNTDGQELYYSLMNIINYKNINKERLNESIKIR